MRRLKRYLWTLVETKAQRYARCRQCAVLLRVEDEAGNDDKETLREHLGHILDEVYRVNLREWARIMVGA